MSDVGKTKSRVSLGTAAHLVPHNRLVPRKRTLRSETRGTDLTWYRETGRNSINVMLLIIHCVFYCIFPPSALYSVSPCERRSTEATRDQSLDHTLVNPGLLALLPIALHAIYRGTSLIRRYPPPPS